MGLKEKKGKKGQAVEYYSRKMALRHLQINLPNFNRLCLMKGIYPSEPNSIKKACKGNMTPKMYFKRKDVNLLLHEPILAKLRDIRVEQLKIKKAKEKGDKDKVYRLMKSKTVYSLHHIAKEIYPTKEDALADIDGALNNVFMFAVLPKMTQFNAGYISLCKRLKLEFLNYCIYQQSLRKILISVKGYYMEADIHGIPVRWSMPHQLTATVLPGNSNYRMQANKLEIDSVVLASLLKNLYTTAGLAYPPQFKMEGGGDDSQEWSDSDMLASLVCPIVRTEEDHREKVTQLSKFKDIDENVAAALEKEERVFAVQSLFKGKKVFLSREVPREVFCFLVMSCGGTVSWDNTVCHGALFPESDADINYHVVDRPLDTAATSHSLSRYYVQPQYLCDSLNCGRLLPVKDYLAGCTMPCHVSPFVEYSQGSYVPPEERYLKGELSAEQVLDCQDNEEEGVAAEEIIYDSADDEEDDEDEEMEMEEQVEEMEEVKPAVQRKSKQELNREIAANKLIKMKEMDIPKKQRNLYNKMKYAEKKKVTDVKKMTEKREAINRKRRSNNNK